MPSRLIRRAAAPFLLLPGASLAYVLAAAGSAPPPPDPSWGRTPERYIQIGHSTPWTWPGPTTKWAAENDNGSGSPVTTPYDIHHNADYVYLRVMDSDVNSGGFVGGNNVAWDEGGIEVTFTVVDPDDPDLSDLKLWDGNPLNSEPDQITATSTTVTDGKEYVVTIEAEAASLPIWFEFQAYTPLSATPELHEILVTLISATDTGPNEEPMEIGWNSQQRFVYEPYDGDFVLSPTCPADTSNNFVQIGPTLETTKIPYMDTEVLGESDGTSYAGVYTWHKVYLYDADSDVNCATYPKYKVGGDVTSFMTDLQITIKQGAASGTTTSSATPVSDFSLTVKGVGTISPVGTSPETWKITIPSGQSSVWFGVAVKRDSTSEDDWEELILELGDYDSTPGIEFLASTSEDVPGIGWKNRMRFLIRDEL